MRPCMGDPVWVRHKSGTPCKTLSHSGDTTAGHGWSSSSCASPWKSGVVARKGWDGDVAESKQLKSRGAFLSGLHPHTCSSQTAPLSSAVMWRDCCCCCRCCWQRGPPLRGPPHPRHRSTPAQQVKRHARKGQCTQQHPTRQVNLQQWALSHTWTYMSSHACSSGPGGSVSRCTALITTSG